MFLYQIQLIFQNLRLELLDLLGNILDCGVASKDNESAAIHCLIILGVIAEAGMFFFRCSLV